MMAASGKSEERDREILPVYFVACWPGLRRLNFFSRIKIYQRRGWCGLFFHGDNS